MTAKLSVMYKQNPDGSYFVVCPNIPGCFTRGDTLEEAEAMIREVIELMVVDMDDEDKQVFCTGKSFFSTIEVEV